MALVVIWLASLLVTFNDAAPVENNLGHHQVLFKTDKFLIDMLSDPIQEMPGEPLSPSDFENARLASLEPLSKEAVGIHVRNRMDGLFEGDIVGVLPRDVTDSSGRKKGTKLHNAVRDSALLWPSGIIPYVISASFDKSERILIARAFLEYQNKTCLRFVPRSSEDDDYLKIIDSNGCWSQVGRKGGEQQISLGYGCWHVGIIMHELMHAVGFWHEQSRTDRDDYIIIHWENIEQGMEYNFQKEDRSQNLDVAYDTGSIMHYEATAFARDPRFPTITAKKPTKRLGQRDGFSDADVLKLNRLYRCATNSTDKKPPPPTTEPTVRKNSSCIDEHKYCQIWMKLGECNKNPWMAVHCRQSCNKCEETQCANYNVNCVQWAQTGECYKNKAYMKMYCPKSCGYCVEPTMVERMDCVDDDRFCRQWASEGQCDINPKFMRQHCRKSCVEC